MSSRRNGLKNIGLLMKEDVVQSPRRLLNQGRHIDWQDFLPRELKVSNPRTDSPRIFHDSLDKTVRCHPDGVPGTLQSLFLGRKLERCQAGPRSLDSALDPFWFTLGHSRSKMVEEDDEALSTCTCVAAVGIAASAHVCLSPRRTQTGFQIAC